MFAVTKWSMRVEVVLTLRQGRSPHSAAAVANMLDRWGHGGMVRGERATMPRQQNEERGRCDNCGKFWRWADLGHMDPQGQICWCPPCVKKHHAAASDRAELANFADLLRAKAGQMPTGEAPRPVCVLVRPGKRTGYRRTDRAAGNNPTRTPNQ